MQITLISCKYYQVTDTNILHMTNPGNVSKYGLLEQRNPLLLLTFKAYTENHSNNSGVTQEKVDSLLNLCKLTHLVSCLKQR